MFRVMGNSGSYFEPTGLAAAKIEVRAFSVVIMPALAIETVCCSCSLSRQISLGRRGTDGRSYHNFVQYTSCHTTHLVKFVYAAYATVAQDERAAVLKA
jgi:hypothetical protein